MVYKTHSLPPGSGDAQCSRILKSGCLHTNGGGIPRSSREVADGFRQINDVGAAVPRGCFQVRFLNSLFPRRVKRK